MKYSGLYFIPNATSNLDVAINIVSSLVQGIETNFQDASRQKTWSLFYRAFRDKISPDSRPPNDADGNPIPVRHRFQHHLHLTTLHQGRTYLCIETPSAPDSIVSIPVEQWDSHAALMRQQFAALWTPHHVLTVQAGRSYDIGLCTIQIGELRAVREGPQAGTVQSPGVVVCISTTVGSDLISQDNDTAVDTTGNMTIDFTHAEAVIRDCWAKIKEGKDLGRHEVKEFIMAKENVSGEREKDAIVRMWCRALRLRG